MFHQCPKYSKNQIEILGYVDVYRLYVYYRAIVVKEIPETSHNHCVL